MADLQCDPTKAKVDSGAGISYPSPFDVLFKNCMLEEENLVSLFTSYSPEILSKRLDWNRLTITSSKVLSDMDNPVETDISCLVPGTKVSKIPLYQLTLEIKLKGENGAIMQTVHYAVNKSYNYWRKLKCPSPYGKDAPYVLPVPLIVIITINATDNWEPCSLSVFYGEDEELSEYIIDVRPFHINLSQLTHDQIRGNVMVRVVIESLILAARKCLRENFHLILSHFAEVKIKGKYAILLYNILTFAGQTSNYISKEDLAASFVKAFGKKGAKMSDCFLDDMLLDERTRGEARGEARGEIKGKAESIIISLKVKFGTITKALEKRIMSMTDPTAMDSFLATAMRCNSLKEVSSLLK